MMNQEYINFVQQGIANANPRLNQEELNSTIVLSGIDLFYEEIPEDKEYMCSRCFTVQQRKELRGADKIKGLSEESSRSLKMCKNCKCRTFWEVK